MKKRKPMLSEAERKAVCRGFLERQARGLGYRELEKWAREQYGIGPSTLYKYRREFAPESIRGFSKDDGRRYKRPAVISDIGRLRGVRLG